MKRIVSKVLFTVLCINMLVIPSIATQNTNERVVGDYLFEVVMDTDSYIKMKITNVTTGDVEWLEEIIDNNGNHQYIANSQDDVLIIDGNDVLGNDVLVDMQNNILPNQFSATATGWSAWGPQ